MTQVEGQPSTSCSSPLAAEEASLRRVFLLAGTVTGTSVDIPQLRPSMASAVDKGLTLLFQKMHARQQQPQPVANAAGSAASEMTTAAVAPPSDVDMANAATDTRANAPAAASEEHTPLPATPGLAPGFDQSSEHQGAGPSTPSTVAPCSGTSDQPPPTPGAAVFPGTPGEAPQVRADVLPRADRGDDARSGASEKIAAPPPPPPPSDERQVAPQQPPPPPPPPSDERQVAPQQPPPPPPPPSDERQVAPQQPPPPPFTQSDASIFLAVLSPEQPSPKQPQQPAPNQQQQHPPETTKETTTAPEPAAKPLAFNTDKAKEEQEKPDQAKEKEREKLEQEKPDQAKEKEREKLEQEKIDKAKEKEKEKVDKAKEKEKVDKAKEKEKVGKPRSENAKGERPKDEKGARQQRSSGDHAQRPGSGAEKSKEPAGKRRAAKAEPKLQRSLFADSSEDEERRDVEEEAEVVEEEEEDGEIVESEDEDMVEDESECEIEVDGVKMGLVVGPDSDDDKRGTSINGGFMELGELEEADADDAERQIFDKPSSSRAPAKATKADAPSSRKAAPAQSDPPRGPKQAPRSAETSGAAPSSKKGIAPASSAKREERTRDGDEDGAEGDEDGGVQLPIDLSAFRDISVANMWYEMLKLLRDKARAVGGRPDEEALSFNYWDNRRTHPRFANAVRDARAHNKHVKAMVSALVERYAARRSAESVSSSSTSSRSAPHIPDIDNGAKSGYGGEVRSVETPDGTLVTLLRMAIAPDCINLEVRRSAQYAMRKGVSLILADGETRVDHSDNVVVMLLRNVNNVQRPYSYLVSGTVASLMVAANTAARVSQLAATARFVETWADEHERGVIGKRLTPSDMLQHVSGAVDEFWEMWKWAFTFLSECAPEA
jgi:hypothetical protein